MCVNKRHLLDLNYYMELVNKIEVDAFFILCLKILLLNVNVFKHFTVYF